MTSIPWIERDLRSGSVRPRVSHRDGEAACRRSAAWHGARIRGVPHTRLGRPGPGVASARRDRMNIGGRSSTADRLPQGLMEHYAAVVRTHAVRLARRLPSHVRLDDLVSAGFFGLADALSKFDGAHPERFYAY